jgi:hypothetical protein
VHGTKHTYGFPVCGNCFRVLLAAREYAKSCRDRSIPAQESHPPPDPSKYRSVTDVRDWQNPYLMVQANGIRPITAAAGASPMSPVGVVAYLEKLPSSAWPYGLVVAVQENGVRAPGDDARIKRNREELVGLLEEAGVRVSLWPSA